jgi:hypothetical protein
MRFCSCAFRAGSLDSDLRWKAHLGGAIAQLGERLNGIQEVSGSIPLGSTKYIRPAGRFRKIVKASNRAPSVRRGYRLRIGVADDVR